MSPRVPALKALIETLFIETLYKLYVELIKPFLKPPKLPRHLWNLTSGCVPSGALTVSG